MSDTRTEATPVAALTIKAIASGNPEANVQVVWCINPQLRDDLRSAQVPSPQILISVTNISASGAATETMRYIEPITLCTKYVSFSRPGKNIVHATVVWDAAGDITRLKRHLLSRDSDGSYSYAVLDYNCEAFNAVIRRDGSISRSTAAACTEVTVPTDMFAKEPPKWLKMYIAKFVRGRAFDQCHFRRRVMFAAPSMLIVLPVVLLIRTIATLVLALIGFRGMNFKPLWQPVSSNTSELFDSVHDPIWFMTRDKKSLHADKYKAQFPVFWIINPFVILVSSIILFIVSSVHVTRDERIVGLLGWSYLKCLSVSALGAVALVVALAALLGALFCVVTGFSWLITKILPAKVKHDSRSFRQKLNDRIVAKRQAAILEARQKAPKRLAVLDGMVCGGDGPRPINPMHTSREKVELWFDRTKHKVCKPFAR